VPELFAEKNDWNRLVELLILHQGHQLEGFNEGPETTRKNDYSLGQIDEPKLAHEEVMKK